MEDLLGCELCPRLVAYRLEQRIGYPHYHNLPVAGVGDDRSRLLIVGLAPGLHGANASGKPFTGDASGRVLFETLHRFGFASRPDPAAAEDGMKLEGCRLTNAVKCLPPKNRPEGAEIRNCNPWLEAEISALAPAAVLLALGAVAHRAVLMALAQPASRRRFAHLAEHALPGGFTLLDSYHCSRYNMNTGRLTRAMFERVFERVRELLR